MTSSAALNLRSCALIGTCSHCWGITCGNADLMRQENRAWKMSVTQKCLFVNASAQEGLRGGGSAPPNASRHCDKMSARLDPPALSSLCRRSVFSVIVLLTLLVV